MSGFYAETNPLATRHTELAMNPNPSLIEKVLLGVLPASRPHSRAVTKLQAARRGSQGRRQYSEVKAVAEAAKAVTVATLTAGQGIITCVAAHGGTAYVGTSSGSLQAWALSAGSDEPLAVRQLTSGQPVVQLQALPTQLPTLPTCAHRLANLYRLACLPTVPTHWRAGAPRRGAAPPAQRRGGGGARAGHQPTRGGRGGARGKAAPRRHAPPVAGHPLP